RRSPGHALPAAYRIECRPYSQLIGASLMLALRLLWRNWRSGEVKLLAGALLLAVAVVSGIAIFTDRLQHTLVQESNVLLGADRVVRGSHPHDPAWEEEAEKAGLS